MHKNICVSIDDLLIMQMEQFKNDSGIPKSKIVERALSQFFKENKSGLEYAKKKIKEMIICDDDFEKKEEEKPEIKKPENKEKIKKESKKEDEKEEFTTQLRKDIPSPMETFNKKENKF